MNETLQTILSRKSVKKFKSEQVPEKLVEKIVAAGLAAPSGLNKQSPIILRLINTPAMR